jgi:hypothetical protein
MLWGVALDIGQMVQQRNSSNPFYERSSTLEVICSNASPLIFSSLAKFGQYKKNRSLGERVCGPRY